MCGIAGIHLKPSCAMGPQTLERLADALLLGIDSRGGHATGYVARARSGEVRLQRASCDARLFIDERRPFPKGTRTVLLHTRFATQGDPAFPENNHPVYAGSIYCVHNGHVSNDRAVMEQAAAKRLGRVDSEAIPVAVHFHGWEHAGEALASLEGPVATALLEAESGGLILARGYSNPVVVLDSPGMVVWASTMNAIDTAWKQVLGTAPGSGRYEWLKEGDLLRFGPEGTRTRERFSSYRPVISYRYSGGWDSADAKKPASRLSHWLEDRLGWGEDDEVVDAIGSGDIVQCADCTDWFLDGELWEIVDDFPVCAGCEARYYRDQDEPVAPVLALPSGKAGKATRKNRKRTRRARTKTPAAPSSRSSSQCSTWSPSPTGSPE